MNQKYDSYNSSITFTPIALLQYFFAADENDRNEVVVKVLQLLTVLVKFGYYDDNNDVKQILPAILKFLNGRNDFPTRQIKVVKKAGRIYKR